MLTNVTVLYCLLGHSSVATAYVPEVGQQARSKSSPRSSKFVLVSRLISGGKEFPVLVLVYEVEGPLPSSPPGHRRRLHRLARKLSLRQGPRVDYKAEQEDWGRTTPPLPYARLIDGGW